MGRGGGILGNILSPVTDLLFGKPKEPDLPPVVTPEAASSSAVNPVSSEADQLAYDAAAKEAERLKKMKGRMSTIATSEQGLLTPAVTDKKQVLGA